MEDPELESVSRPPREWIVPDWLEARPYAKTLELCLRIQKCLLWYYGKPVFVFESQDLAYEHYFYEHITDEYEESPAPVEEILLYEESITDNVNSFRRDTLKMTADVQIKSEYQLAPIGLLIHPSGRQLVDLFLEAIINLAIVFDHPIVRECEPSAATSLKNLESQVIYRESTSGFRLMVWEYPWLLHNMAGCIKELREVEKELCAGGWEPKLLNKSDTGGRTDLSPKDEHKIVEVVGWTVPRERTEWVRRLSGTKGIPRSRDFEKLIQQFGYIFKEVTGSKPLVFKLKLDGLDPATRKRAEK